MLDKAVEMDSRVSSSLEDKNPGEPPEVTPENDNGGLWKGSALDPSRNRSRTRTSGNRPRPGYRAGMTGYKKGGMG